MSRDCFAELPRIRMAISVVAAIGHATRAGNIGSGLEGLVGVSLQPEVQHHARQRLPIHGPPVHSHARGRRRCAVGAGNAIHNQTGWLNLPERAELSVHLSASFDRRVGKLGG